MRKRRRWRTKRREQRRTNKRKRWTGKRRRMREVEETIFFPPIIIF
jgi:hypothetical protein